MFYNPVRMKLSVYSCLHAGISLI